jgi:hypothetical protein
VTIGLYTLHMPHFCILPCERFFTTEHALQVHRARSSACQERWNDQLGFNSQIPVALSRSQSPDEAVLSHAESSCEDHMPDDGMMEDLGGFADPDAALIEMELDDHLPDGAEDYPGPPIEDDDRPHADVDLNDDPAESDTDSKNSGPIEEEIDRTAARVLRSQKSAFDSFYDAQVAGQQGNLYYPFAGAVEWQFARWAHSSGLSRSQIDELLNLDYVSVIP